MKPKLIAFAAALTVFSGYTPKSNDHLVLNNKELSEETNLFLPDDLEATLWAESPKFYNPTNMDVDIKGRIWITEAVNYRKYNNKAPHFKDRPEGDRVVILEDKDGDGVAESSKVFVQDKDLVAPLGMAVIGNKVIVSSAPSIIVYTDENGDDKPDKKEVFLTGFGGLDHDHSLHAMFAGPDGKYYFNAGNAGPHMVTDKAGWNLRSGSNYNGGSPYNNSNKGGLVSDDGKMWVGGIALRINPDGTGLKVLGHNFRNSYEFTVDSYGTMWQNDNDDDGNRGVRVSWLMEGANMGYASADGTRRWEADRRPGQSNVTGHWHQEDPGVMPLGDNTGAGSPTGVAFNESDLLGEKYRGMLMACDAGRNVVFAYKPQTNGAGYDLNRQNLITSLSDKEVAVAQSSVREEEKTKWFRPSDVVVGADGAIYVADWYDSMVGGHRMTDTTGTGRIYRIAPKGKKLTTPKINLKNTKGQIAALLSPAVNVRNSGFVLLAAQGSKAVKDVKKILSSTNPYHRARAIWLLSNMGPSGVPAVQEALKDSDPNIRITAFRALRQVNKDISSYVAQLSKDLSPAVRREVAVALRDIPVDASSDAIITLATAYAGTDRYYLEALGQAAEGKEEALYPVLNAKLGAEPLKWSPAFSDIVWRLHPKGALSALKERAASDKLTADQRKQALVAIGFIKDQAAVDAMQDLMAGNDASIKEQALWWLKYRQGNEWSNFKMTLPASQSEINAEAQKKMLAQKLILENNASSLKDKATAVKAMAKDKVGGEMLIGLAVDKKLSKELINEISQVIFTNPDQTVRVLASDYFKKPGGTAVLSISKIAKLQGDLKTGKLVFQGKCATCHRVGNEGANIGPELTQIGRKFEKNGLLDAIINPSAGMAFGYESWLITKKDGSMASGFLQADGETVVLKGMAGEKYNIKASDIASRKQFATSIMPEPTALGLSEKDLANLTDYLLTLK
ncbi:MAG: c-type cytochrome [Pedobacter sp.]|nr:MAG: c-type cytochrome [Pedobacter sp.]